MAGPHSGNIRWLSLSFVVLSVVTALLTFTACNPPRDNVLEAPTRSHSKDPSKPPALDLGSVPEVTNKAVQVLAPVAATTVKLEKVNTEIERLKWILYRGVRGDENEMETRTRLSALELEYSEAIADWEARKPPPPGVIIPEDLKRMEDADPLVDLANAISTNDFRFIALYGYTAVVPGVSNSIAFEELRLIKGTSDYIRSPQQARLQSKARKYAARYNEALTHFLKTNKAQQGGALKTR